MFEPSAFKFKKFELLQNDAVFKIGTDAFVLGSWIGNLSNAKRILDVGTGTGVLALMAAQHFPNAIITAIDNNNAAVELAKLNFSKSHLGENCHAICLDFLSLKSQDKFDLIVSNPPYFLDSSTPDNALLEQAKHLNLNGLNLFFESAAAFLSMEGKLCIIHPIDSRFRDVAAKSNLFPHRILNVYGKPKLLKRQCVQYGFDPKQPRLEELTIRDNQGHYTTAYKDFTREFHGVIL